MEFGLSVLCLCALAGAALVWFFFAAPARRRADRAEMELEAERKAHNARLEEADRMRGEAETRFAALAADALGKNSDSFLRLVSERFQSHKVEADKDLQTRQEAIAALVRPLGDKLEKFDAQVQRFEKERAGDHKSISEQVKQLQSETGRLVQALRQPQTRGRWGEHQLRNVLEMAGMTKHVDFVEQDTVRDRDGGAQRPDVVVRLPGGKSIVIDAKTPLQAYLDAVEAEDEEARATHIQAHVRHVRNHVRMLSSKEYWNALPGAPDFVVMFIPGESFFAAALENDPRLFDEAVAMKVLISTPTSLIALVKAIAYGWQQERIAENAQAISASGRELYERIRVFGEHMADVGKSLRQAVERYNKGVGSLENRVLPSARRFEQLGAAPAGSALPAPEPIDAEPRNLQSAELTARINGSG